MRIPCRGDLSLLLKISQNPGKTLTRIQHYMYFMHLVILHYYNVTWLSIPLWIYGRTWTFLGFFNMGNTLPKLHQNIGIAYNNSSNTIHGGIITLSDAYHKATKWFLHHMNDLVLFRRYTRCRNLSLGLATKAKGCKVAGQEGDLGVTSHAPESVKSVRE